eukprot:8532-Prorocentrum_minimum.AAC.2
MHNYALVSAQLTPLRNTTDCRHPFFRSICPQSRHQSPCVPPPKKGATSGHFSPPFRTSRAQVHSIMSDSSNCFIRHREIHIWSPPTTRRTNRTSEATRGVRRRSGGGPEGVRRGSGGGLEGWRGSGGGLEGVWRWSGGYPPCARPPGPRRDAE